MSPTQPFIFVQIYNVFQYDFKSFAYSYHSCYNRLQDSLKYSSQKSTGRSDKMDTAKIGIFIQEQRKKNQLSQKQLAEYMHVSPTTVCKWEKGKK